MPLPPIATRILHSIALARQVEHYYWAYTTADDQPGKVSIENLRAIIERMIRKPIRKYEISFEGSVVQGICERHPDRIIIYVKEDLAEPDRRYISVKEMSHALADIESEYCHKGVETIHQLVKYRGLRFDGGETEAMRSERLAEFLALEILYPISYREPDRKAVYEDRTISLGQLEEKRGVPAYLLEAALDKEYLESCSEAWALIAKEVKFDPLIPLPNTP